MAENKLGFSHHQLMDEKRKRKFQKVLVYPYRNDFREIISNKMIPNCPILPIYVENEMTIYGQNLGVLKGKTVRKTPI